MNIATENELATFSVYLYFQSVSGLKVKNIL
jgi:hypothetical protein